MKKIVLHGPSTDEAGNFCDAGAELEVVSDRKGEGKAGFISADRARDLVARGGAVSATASAEIEKAARPVPRKAPRRRTSSKKSGSSAPIAAPAKAPAAPPAPVEQGGKGAAAGEDKQG